MGEITETFPQRGEGDVANLTSVARLPKFLDKRKSTLDSGSHQKEAGWQVLLTLASPYTADS